MSSARALRVYRPPGLSVFLAYIGDALLFVVGLSMVTIGPSQRDGASTAVLGSLVLLGSVLLGAALATTRLIVTEAGLIYWYYLRRRFIGWPEIRSFGVGPSRGRMG